MCVNSRHSFRPFLCRFFLFEFMCKSLHFPRDEHRKRRRRRRMAWMAATRYERCCSSRGLCYLRPRRCHRKVALASSSSSPSASHSSGPHDETFRSLLPPRRTHSPPSDTTKQRTSEIIRKRDIKAEDEIFRVSLSEDDGECLRMIP